MKSLGSRIRHVRGTESQEAFAARIGVSKGAISGYERDENSPSADVILKICSKADISVEWLMTGRGVMRAAGGGEAVAPTPPLEQSLVRLDAKLERVEAQRDELLAENRRLHQENAELLRRNGDLREHVARLEGVLANCRQKMSSEQADQSILFDELKTILHNDRL